MSTNHPFPAADRATKVQAICTAAQEPFPGRAARLTSHISHLTSRTALLCLLTLPALSMAQSPEPPPDNILEQASPSPDSADPGGPVNPVPDEDVMHPTKSGLPFSESLARAFALGWISQNLGDRVDLTPEQLSQFSTRIAERAVRAARENPEVTRDALEGLFESVIVRGPRERVDPDIARKTSERMRPVIEQWHELLDGIARDGEATLAPDQQEEVRKAVERRHRRLDNLDEMMQRWSNGEFRDTDRIDRLLDPHVSDDEIEVPQSAPAHPEYRRARRRVGWQMQRIGPAAWLQFLTVVKSSFHFDAEQTAKADRLYADYKAKAEAIMTRPWREALRDNRTRSELRWSLKDLPGGPWLFHLEQEYKTMIAPIEAMKAQFQKDLLALVTDAQRAAFLDELKERVAAHGLVMQDADRAALEALLR